ncbi:35676_t:CDS:2 [Gigaspora margarita]|uniref:35676_t:CDS:1 n=1 Tax=Gigaspora margarita TaxID=4874 RepID=A0ABN7UVA4_GIGMA|nr:35676_t:CDS:2 [Gigaspora margarita]
MGAFDYSNFKIEQSVKLKQDMKLLISQEESFMLKESNVIKDKEVPQESCKVQEVQIRHRRNNKTRAKLAIEINRKNNNSILEKRRTYHARLKNVPKNTKEVLLLKQICHLDVKTVHIFNNRNDNRKEVTVELKPVFKTIQEMVNNGNKNLQKDILGRIKYELIKKQNRETLKARSKVIKIFKENPYMNNSSASTMLKEKTQKLDIDEIKNLL